MNLITFGDLTEAGKDLAEALRAQQESVAVSESAAGGLINAALVAVPGASDFYKGGMIVYTSAGRNLLAINEPLPSNLRGATEAFAVVQANRAKQMYEADWGIGETGATGPSANPYGDPAGFGWVACNGKSEQTLQLQTEIDDRVANMHAFALAALQLAVETIKA